MKHLSTSFKIIFFCILFCFNGYSTVPPDSLENKIDAIFKLYAVKTGPGCAIAIIKDGQVVFKKAYGLASLEYNIPLTTETVFDIASVSKQFTGFAISSLIQEGKISQNDDIRKYLPEVHDFEKKITINHLLRHTSGIWDWWEVLQAAGWRRDGYFSFEDAMLVAKRQKELDFESGSRYSYSNTGFNLLARIVEKASGQSFHSWMDKHVFKPLQMRSSLVFDDPKLVVKNFAASYCPIGTGFEKELYTSTAYGSSCILSSASDLCKWAINFDRQLMAKNPVYMRMIENDTFNNGTKINYGYGLELQEEGGLKVAVHNGGSAGYRSIISNYLSEHLSIIALSNCSDFTPNFFASKIADLMLGRTPKVPALDKIKNAPTLLLNKAIIEKYTGNYQLDTNWFVTVTLVGQQLMSRANNENAYPMEAKSDTTFWISAYNDHVTFVKDQKNKRYLLKHNNVTSSIIDSYSPTEESLNQFCGNFYCGELATGYKIFIVGGKLTMWHFRLGEIELIPHRFDGTFISSNGVFKFKKDEKQNIIGFNLSVSRLRKLWFEKR